MVMSEHERISLVGYDPTIVSRAFDRIREIIASHFAERTHNLIVVGTLKNSFDKCGDCVWFHKGTRFCAVAPQNLTSFECADRQLPEPVTNLNYLEARSPEIIVLLQELAEKLEIGADTLERRLYEGWVKHPEAFGMTTRGLLAEIERYGDYSIAQIELIGDGIRLNIEHTIPCLIAGAIREKILAGQTFEEIMHWLIPPNNN